MILSQPDLRKAVQSGEIVFDPPLEENQWGQASIDLRLGFHFTRLKNIKGVTLSVAEGLNALKEMKFWDEKILKKTDALGDPETFCL